MSKKIELEELRIMIDRLFWDDNRQEFNTEDMLDFMIKFDFLNKKRIETSRAISETTKTAVKEEKNV